jgi:hypothetical protein
MKTAFAAAAAGLLLQAAPAFAAPEGADSPRIEESFDALKDAVTEVSARSEREPAVLERAERRELDGTLRELRAVIAEAPKADRAGLAEALNSDARMLRRGAEASDRAAAREDVTSAIDNIELLNRGRGPAGTANDVHVQVSVFTVRGTARVGGFSVQFHRVGNPAAIQDFPGVTKSQAPTTSWPLIPGRYHFIVQQAGRTAAADRPVGGGAAQDVEVPVN